MVRSEFQKVLSFSWNCEVMVGSAASHGATRPSYFGPESQKFISNGLAASAAGPNANRPSTTPSAAPIAGFFRNEKRSRMGNPPNGILREFGGRRCREAWGRSSATRQHFPPTPLPGARKAALRSFHRRRCPLSCANRNAVCDANHSGGGFGGDRRNAGTGA